MFMRPVKLRDLDSRQSLHTLSGHTSPVFSAAFSPEGALLAPAGCDRTVKLWDVASGRLLRSLPHADEVLAVAFSPYSKLLVSSGYDHQIYLRSFPRLAGS
jgi:WD40 repeat protein